MKKAVRFLSIKNSLVRSTLFFGAFTGLVSCAPKNLEVTFKNSGLISGQVKSASTGGSQKILTETQIQNQSLNLSPLSNCNSPKVSLFELGSDGQKSTTALSSAPVANDGTYQLKLPTKTLDQNKTYLVEVAGCSENLSRVVTESAHQDISLGTSLISSWLPNSAVADRLQQADKGILKTLLSAVRDSDSYTLAYSTILNNTELNSDFQRVFGVSPNTLLNVSPETVDFSVPTTLQEGQSTTLNIAVKHWSPTYQFAYRWMIDDTVIGTTSNITFTPHANMQGLHTLKIFYGARTSSNELDLTKPYKQKSVSVSIDNTLPPVVPLVTLGTPALSNSRNIIVNLDTGALQSNCASFSRIAIKEDLFSRPMSESEFQYVCNTAGSQPLSFALQGADGSHTLYIWTQDSAGQISATSRTLTLQLDTVAPSLSISTPTLNSRAKGSFLLSGVCEPSTSVSIAGAGVSSQATSCVTGVFSTTVALTAVENTKTFSVTQTDLAGNSSTVNWSLLRDDTAPAPLFTSPNASSSYQNSLTVTGSCSQGTGICKL